MTFKKIKIQLIIILIINLISLGNTCENGIYCKGRLYELIQENINEEFLDKKILVDPKHLFLEFKNLTRSEDSEISGKIESFFSNYFDDEKEGVDYEQWNLPGKLIEPNTANDRNLITFLTYLKTLLLKMGLKGTNIMRKHKNRYSLLSTNGFIKQHKEAKQISYWETYWVVNGLLFYEMYETTKVILNGLISMVIEFGFVPKANRIYYTQRSNPPFLTIMALNYVLKSSDYDWLQKNIHYLELELTFWIKNRTIEIEKNGNLYTMFRYSVNCFTPRPEYYKIDKELAEELDESDKKMFFKEIHSASESGWGFSSRWLLPENSSKQENNTSNEFLNLNVTRVIPVDLNSYIYKNFISMSKLFNILGNYSQSVIWRKKAEDLHIAIRLILWNERKGFWFDYDIELKKSRPQFYLSNFAPLWSEAFPVQFGYEYGYYASLYIDKHNLIGKYKGCIPDSLQETYQLFDFPNSHSHLIVMLIHGLKSTLNMEAIKKSNVILVTWMDAVMSCWAETQTVFDTYNAKEFGQHTSYTEWTEDHTVTIGAFLDILDNYYTVTERAIITANGRGSFKTIHILSFIIFVISFFC